MRDCICRRNISLTLLRHGSLCLDEFDRSAANAFNIGVGRRGLADGYVSLLLYFSNTIKMLYIIDKRFFL